MSLLRGIVDFFNQPAGIITVALTGFLIIATAVILRFTFVKRLPKGYQHPIMGVLRILTMVFGCMLLGIGMAPIIPTTYFGGMLFGLALCVFSMSLASLHYGFEVFLPMRRRRT